MDVLNKSTGNTYVSRKVLGTREKSLIMNSNVTLSKNEKINWNPVIIFWYPDSKCTRRCARRIGARRARLALRGLADMAT